MAKAKKAALSPDLARLESLMELMGRHQVGELEWERGNERICIRAQGASSSRQQMVSVPAHAPAVQSPIAAPAAAQQSSGKPASGALPGNQKQILSPFVGTFYRQSKPGSEPYCREGQVVKRGDVLCIIEAMKLMNEIESESNGKIVSILVENGQPVEFGEPLFVIET